MTPVQTTAEARPAIVAGVVEAMALIDVETMFLSGWSRNHPAPGAAVAVATAHGSRPGRFWPLWSDRADVGPGNSFCGIIALEGEVDPRQIVGIRLPDTQVLAIYDQVTRLEAAQASALLRQALAGRPDDPTRRALVPFSSRFDGTDSVNNSTLPIRIGIDDGVVLGSRVLLRGWLFDPEGLVDSVSLVGDGTSQRLDADWVGQKRPDVAAAMASDARLGTYAAPHDFHGFSVIGECGGGPAHLTLLTGGETLHLPIISRPGNPLALLRGFVIGLDPEAPGTPAVLSKQVVPALLDAALPPPPVLVRLEGEPATTGVSLIVGCAGDCADIPALLHILAARPGAASLPIVIAGHSRELSSHANEITARASFLGLSLQLASCDHVEDELDALTAAATAAGGPLVMLTTARHLPDLVAARDASTALASGGPGALLVTSSAPAGIEPTHLALVASRSDFVRAGGFTSRRLTVPGKWAALPDRLAAVLGRPPARVAIPTTATIRFSPAQQLLQRVDRLAAAAETQAPDA
jgi:O-antigen biosynthesis protein